MVHVCVFQVLCCFAKEAISFVVYLYFNFRCTDFSLVVPVSVVIHIIMFLSGI